MGHVDFTDPTRGMVERLIGAGLNPLDVMYNRTVYLPPGNGLVAAIQATTIYGLTEVWPQTIRINRRANGSFGIDEIVDPQALRQVGVRIGASWRARETPVLVPRELFNRLISQCGDSQIAAELRALTEG